MPDQEPLLDVKNLKMHFPIVRGFYAESGGACACGG
jgi:hypothetical protein